MNVYRNSAGCDPMFYVKVNWSHYVYLQRLAVYVQRLITDMLSNQLCLVLLTCVPMHSLTYHINPYAVHTVNMSRSCNMNFDTHIILYF